MRFRKIHYQKISKEEQSKWRNESYKLAKKAVLDVTKEQFESFFFNPKIQTIAYFAMEDKKKNLVSFFCGYYQIIQLNNKPIYIYNSRVVVDPDYQGKSIFINTFFAQFRACGGVAFRKGGYFISNIINPISYHSVASISAKAYPKYDAPFTKDMKKMITKMAEINNTKLIKSNNIFKTVSGVPAKYSEKQLDRIYSSEKPHIKYFLKQDIDFLNGEGILVIVPYTIVNIVNTIFNALKRKIKSFFIFKKNSNNVC